jgi:hypothetical protein
VTLPILQALYQDGAVYFVLVFAMRLWTGLQLAIGVESLFYLSIFAEYAFTSTAISRLFIHLRSVAVHNTWDNGGHTQCSASITIMQPYEVISMDPFGQQRRWGRQSISIGPEMSIIDSQTELLYN